MSDFKDDVKPASILHEAISRGFRVYAFYELSPEAAERVKADTIQSCIEACDMTDFHIRRKQGKEWVDLTSLRVIQGEINDYVTNQPMQDLMRAAWDQEQKDGKDI